MILFLLFSAGHERLMSTVTIKIYDWILKTDQIVTLGLFILLAQLMATVAHYTYTEPLSGLIDWSDFVERVLPTL